MTDIRHLISRLDVDEKIAQIHGLQPQELLPRAPTATTRTPSGRRDASMWTSAGSPRSGPMGWDTCRWASR
ncbi:hypothetical protein [Tessaracoccus defluvii]|uniref:Uncharacterized protein n=1 Tax=Tessaracoccus defluvii TaxID=1285901 RepID=A0A7H0H4H9_9ACTN|nr:hypothetical protein [Tessaracoccus defluvii]QNP55445.1 hypothetical protein H9L22_14765 [Tessaracoccus defluvii]